MRRALLATVAVATVILFMADGAYAAQSGDVNGDGIVCMKSTGGGKLVVRDNEARQGTSCPRGFLAVDLREPRLQCDSLRECGELRELCIAAGWVYRDIYEQYGPGQPAVWIGGQCDRPPGTPTPQ